MGGASPCGNCDSYIFINNYQLLFIMPYWPKHKSKSVPLRSKLIARLSSANPNEQQAALAATCAPGNEISPEDEAFMDRLLRQNESARQ
jgi:hypothetical protein